MIKLKTIKQTRIKRLSRIRAKIHGSAMRPRLTIYRSNTSLSVQFIDDDKKTVIFMEHASGKNVVKAKELGISVAKKAQEKGIKEVVFDRSGYRYHGVVKAFADAIREGGIKL
jgi:large subunit ribosomal protein L18